MSMLLLTGFPGFLGAELLPRLLLRDPERNVVCLVQRKYLGEARARVAALAGGHPALGGRIRLVVGDVTQPGLGLLDADGLQRRTREIFHLAAVHDLGATRARAERVNLDGTRHALDFAAGCTALRRFHHVSSCSVSGRYDGVFAEEDLDLGQAFNSPLEETKLRAEAAVRERMRGGLPATIYRPAVIVGDSRTGTTQKYDGVYHLIRWLLRQPKLAILPTLGEPRRTRFNMVPRDYVADAIAALSGLERSRGRVYQLADPMPPVVDEILQIVARATRRAVLRIPLGAVAQARVGDGLPAMPALPHVPPGIVDLFVHPTRYTTRNAEEDLAGRGIAPPAFTSYVERLVHFVRQHPAIESAAMA